MFGFLQQYPAGLNVTDQFPLRWDVHATAADLQPRLDVEELDFYVASLTVPARIVTIITCIQLTLSNFYTEIFINLN